MARVKRGAFRDRKSAQKYILEALDELRLSLRRQVKLLESELKTINGEIRSATKNTPTKVPPANLVDARSSVFTTLKNAQNAQARFIIDIAKMVDALADLEQKDAVATINIVLPDWGAIPVVETIPRPDDTSTSNTDD